MLLARTIEPNALVEVSDTDIDIGVDNSRGGRAAINAVWDRIVSNLRTPRPYKDEVVHIIEGRNDVKLQRGGVVLFASVRVPLGYRSGGSLPECADRSLVYVTRKLLSTGTAMEV